MTAPNQPEPTVERLAEIDAELATLACSDGGCCIRKPQGQHTNAGCRCISPYARDWTPGHASRIRRALWLRQEQASLLATREREAEVRGRVASLEAMAQRFEDSGFGAEAEDCRAFAAEVAAARRELEGGEGGDA
jgi:hypothetical protein